VASINTDAAKAKFFIMVLFPCVFTDYPVHCGRENTDSVDADMGLQFTDAIKFCFRSRVVADGPVPGVNSGKS
jgi:hypothetical protein